MHKTVLVPECDSVSVELQTREKCTDRFMFTCFCRHTTVRASDPHRSTFDLSFTAVASWIEASKLQKNFL